jgi:hypothetical protein
MLTPPDPIIHLVATFATAFTAPTFARVQVLLFGAILTTGRRTVASTLRAMGLGQEQHFTNYHRVLNRDHWSPWVLSKLLLNLIVKHCLAPHDPLLIIMDDTLERRAGRRIRYKGWFHDAVRSTVVRTNVALGIRWLCLTLSVPVPWSSRAWALPFLTFPALSEKVSLRLGKRPHTIVEQAGWLIARVRRWLPQRDITVVADGAYAAVSLVRQCQQLDPPVKLVSRLRLDARLFARPSPHPAGKRGKKAAKGPREPRLLDRLADPATEWETWDVTWYGGEQRPLETVTGVSLWYRATQPPVQIRWVLVRCPESWPKRQRFKPVAFFCSEPSVTPQAIIWAFIARWGIEVTFEEVRAHLGFETQRQWSDRAIERTTPCLLGVFSLVILMAKVNYGAKLPIRRLSWYDKEEATFADALAAVRRTLWDSIEYDNSCNQDELIQLPKQMADSLMELACRAV